MRQPLTLEDEPHLLLRSLCIDYAPGACIRTHSHAWAQLLYAVSGALRATTDGQLWTVPPRRALWLPAGIDHRVQMLGAVQLRTIYCSPRLVPPFEHARQVGVTGLLHELLLRVCEHGWLDGRLPNDTRLAGLLLEELGTAQTARLQLPLPRDPRALQLVEDFNNPSLAQVPLSRLLQHAGLSRRTAERVFAKETGLSPARWRKVTLLNQALEHLLAGASVEDAATRAGFASRSAFSGAFASLFGVGPAALRQQRKLEMAQV